ncbi:MAG: isocitrate lyase/PEP mutase family protein [Sciscionella sp.]
MSEFIAPRPPVRRRLRELLARPEPLLAPGVYDGLTARLVEQAGFESAYMTGFGTSAALLGRPDIGLLTQTEMVDNARRISQAVHLPLIADADTGYGNALNVVRTVRDYEQAGVAALQLEDQVAPKRCGHMSGKAVIDIDEAVAKIRAAVAARTDPDLVLIARTDAAAVHGIGAAIERGRRFADAGADMLFIESPRAVADIEAVATELAGYPLLFNWVEGGRTESITLRRLVELGFRLVIYPISTLLAATAAVREVLLTLRTDSATDAYAERMDDFDGFLETIGLAEIREVEQRFRS